MTIRCATFALSLVLAICSPSTQAETPSPQRTQSSAADLAAFGAVANIEDLADRTRHLRKFIREHARSPVAPIAKDWLLRTLILAKAPSREIVDAAEKAAAALPEGSARALALNAAAAELAGRGELLEVALAFARRAVANLPQGTGLASTDVFVRDTLGWVYVRRGELNTAIRTLTDSAAKAPDDQQTLFHLGVALEREGRRDEAIDAYVRSAAVMFGTDERATQALARIVGSDPERRSALSGKLEAAREASRQRVVFTSRRVDSASPSWELRDLSGVPVRLADERGKVVVLDFWGTWCAPCRAELPSFDRVRQRYQDRDVVFLAVALEQPGALEARTKAVEDFLAANKYTFRVALDADHSVANAYGVEDMPTVLVIDGTGQTRFRNAGYDEHLDTILEEQLHELWREAGRAAPS